MVVLMPASSRTLIASLALVTLAAGGAVALSQTAEKPRARTVDVVAERFSFTPSEIKATVGETLTIRLTSDDTAHGFRIVGTDVDIEIPKRSRGQGTVTFTPEAPGRYTFECSRLCGAGHGFMRGEIVVTERAKDAR